MISDITFIFLEKRNFNFYSLLVNYFFGPQIEEMDEILEISLIFPISVPLFYFKNSKIPAAP
jgi:hypothetical protein